MWGLSTTQGAQRLFEEAQATHDPNNIVAVLQHHPYHIDALMAMFELHRHASATGNTHASGQSMP